MPTRGVLWSCLRPQLRYKLAWLVLISALVLTSPTLAEDNQAGDGTVAEWRAKLGRHEIATASYAAGVMAVGNLFTQCKNPRTVRQLHTYLLYGAPATFTIKQAIWNFLIEGECTVPAEERVLSANAPQYRPKATIYGEEN